MSDPVTATADVALEANRAGKARATQDRGRLLLFGLLCLVACLALYAQATREMVASDDNLWLGYAVDKVLDRDAGNRLEDRVIEAARAKGADEESLYRLQMRRQYDVNYRLPIALWRAFDRALLFWNQDFDTRMAQRFALALFPVLLVPWLVLSCLVWRASRPVFLASILVLSWYALIAFVDAAEGRFIVFGSPLRFKTLVHLIVFVMNPGPAFSIYGITPRSMLTVLVCAAMLARWSGRERLGYGLLALAVGVHTSLGLFVLTCVLLGDFILARQRLRSPVSVTFIGLAFGYVLLNERMFSFVAPTAGLALGLAALVSLPLLAWWVRADDPLARLPWLARRRLARAWHRLSSGADPVRQDVIVACTCLLVALVVSCVVSQFASPISVTYFWGQLPTRLFAAIGPAALIGIVARLAGHAEIETVVTTARTLVFAASAVGLLFVFNQKSPLRTMRGQLVAIGTVAAGERCSRIGDERWIYYALGRALFTGSDDPIAAMGEPPCQQALPRPR